MSITARELLLSGDPVTTDLLDRFEREVRSGAPRTVTVAVDPARHTGEPKSEVERLTWELVDTVWNLMREYSVRVTLAEIREQAREQGLGEIPADDELFREARESGDPDAPSGYLDLAPENLLAYAGLVGAFDVLLKEAHEDARQGFDRATDL